MSIDELAEDAAAGLRTRAAATFDVSTGLANLGRTSTRRGQLHRTAAIGSVAAIVLVGWLAVRTSTHVDVPPAGPGPTTQPSTPEVHANGPIIASRTDVSAADGSRKCVVASVDPSTGESTAATQPGPAGCASSYAWSADGTSVAGLVRSDQGTAELVVWPGDGGTRRVLRDCTSCGALAWTSDNRSLVVADGSTLLLVDVATGEQRTVTSGRSGEHVDGVTTSPDGGTAAVSVARCPAGTSCRAAGGSSDLTWRIDLVDLASGGSRPLLVEPRPGVIPLSPRWSPDGTQIAFVELTRLDPTSDRRVLIRTVDPRDAAVRVLRDSAATCACVGRGPTIAWSPDGSLLAVSAPDGQDPAGWPLLVLPSDGGAARLVPTSVDSVLGWKAGS